MRKSGERNSAKGKWEMVIGKPIKRTCERRIHKHPTSVYLSHTHISFFLYLLQIVDSAKATIKCIHTL